MLHDIGHGPFSHILEEAAENMGLRFNHEEMTLKIIKEKYSKLGLEEEDANEIIQILDKDGKAPQFLKEIISGAYDCDKLDYLVRDGDRTGAKEYGQVDYERIISSFVVVNGKLLIASPALDALMNSFEAIQSMYTTVYSHKTVRAFDLMLIDALSSISEFLRNEVVADIDNFLRYDDYFLIHEVKHLSENTSQRGMGEAAKIFDDFLNRRVRYKEIFLRRLSIGVRAEMTSPLEKLAKKLRESEYGKGLNIHVDFRPDIRPIGMKPREIVKWLLEERIYDLDEGGHKRLVDICEAYFEKLSKHIILFRVYAGKEEVGKKENEPKIEEIKKIAREGIKELEEQYRKDRERYSKLG